MMGKQILFLVHGMGEHKENEWADEVKQKLIEVAGNYSGFQDTSLDERVEFVPINYDHIYEDLLQSWKQDSSAVRNLEDTGNLDIDNLLGWLDGIGEDDKEFFWSHIADVIIYRFFGLYRKRIQSAVIKQLATKIDEVMKEQGQANCYVMAHSLGTVVAHDSLHLLGATEWEEHSTNPLGPDIWKFQAVFMLANTSRLLQSDIDVFDSTIIKPGWDSDTYLFRYLNFYHEFDPVPFPRKFEPAGWGFQFKDVDVRHFRELNIHAFTHYLDHPRVHIPILKSLTHASHITQDEEESAIEEYEDINLPNISNGELNEFKLELENLKQTLDTKDQLIDIIKNLPKYYSAIEQLKPSIQN